MELPLVSIILVNYNGKNYIKQCIQSILKTQYKNFELIVVDNDSSDQSLDDINEELHDFRIKILRNTRNLGFAEANNIGVKHTNGTYVVLLNIDTRVHSTWLEELIWVMEHDCTIGVAQPKLLSLDDRTTYDSAGDYLDFFGNCFRRGGSWYEKDNGQYDIVQDIFSARGAALITRREIIEKIGLFDDNFFMFFEDFDFCWRVRLYGKRVVFVPQAIVYHKGGGISTNQQSSESANMHAFKNQFVCLLKNYNTTNMIKYAVLYLIIYLATGLFLFEPFIIRRNDKKAWIKGRLQAYYWIFRNIRKLRNSRYEVQHTIRKVSDSEIMKYMIRTSLLDTTNLAINIQKIGLLNAKMHYFNKGLSTIN
jgi:GT2 family glycosyltransferase